MRKRLLHYLSCFLLIFICFSCSNNVEEIYFSKYSFEDAKVSNPLLLDLKLNTTKRYLEKDNEDAYVLTDSTLNKGNLIFNLTLDSNNNILKTKKEEKIVHVFERVTSNDLGVSENEINILLRKNVWKQISRADNKDESFDIATYYNFKNDTVNKVKNYMMNGVLVRSEVQSYKYFIRKYKKHYFLQIIGIHPKNKFNVILEIRKISENLSRFSGIKGFETLELQKAGISHKKLNSYKIENFQICNEDLIGQYYYNNQGSQYKGGNQKIKKLVSDKIKKSNKKTDTGYIRIRFIVNCEGNIGNFSILEVDENYKVTDFSDDLVLDLFFTVAKLKDWSLGRLTENGDYYDNYKYITFKIRNGEVLAVLP